jgi:cupin 2 domain-containing protein
MSKTSNLYRELPANIPEEAVQSLVSGETVRIERIVSHGHASPLGSGTINRNPSGS